MMFLLGSKLTWVKEVSFDLDKGKSLRVRVSPTGHAEEIFPIGPDLRGAREEAGRHQGRQGIHSPSQE